MKKFIFLLVMLFPFLFFSQTDCGIDLKEAFKEKYSLNNQEDLYNHFQSFFSLSETELDELAKKHESGDSIEGQYGAYAIFWSKNRKKQQFRKRFNELKIRNEASFTIDNSFYTEYYKKQ